MFDGTDMQHALHGSTQGVRSDPECGAPVNRSLLASDINPGLIDRGATQSIAPIRVAPDFANIPPGAPITPARRKSPRVSLIR
jgi:hypothetical protein